MFARFEAEWKWIHRQMLQSDAYKLFFFQMRIQIADGNPPRCGEGNACCKYGDKFDVSECRAVVYYSTLELLGSHQVTSSD